MVLTRARDPVVRESHQLETVYSFQRPVQYCRSPERHLGRKD